MEYAAAVRLPLTLTRTRWAMLPDASMRAVLDRGGAQGYVENKAAQTSASWLSGGPFQGQTVPQAALSFGQPRPISRLGRAGRPYRPCFSHRRAARTATA